jgi:hypothetical protein
MKNRRSFLFVIVIGLLHVQSLNAQQIYTAFLPMCGTASLTPRRIEGRLSPSETGSLWASSSGLTNGKALLLGNTQTASSNGGVYVRSLSDGFWSGWTPIPYIPYVQNSNGSNNNYTFATDLTRVRQAGTTSHPVQTHVTVSNPGSSSQWNQFVEVRAGRTADYPSLLASAWGDNDRKVNQYNQIDYRIPYSDCFVTTTKAGWDYIAPFQGAGVPLTINMQTSTQIVKVKKGCVPVTNCNVYAIHADFFNLNSPSSQTMGLYQANWEPMETNTEGVVYPKVQFGLPFKFVAFDDTDDKRYESPTVIPNSGGIITSIVFFITTPTLISPADFSLMPTNTVAFHGNQIQMPWITVLPVWITRQMQGITLTLRTQQ